MTLEPKLFVQEYIMETDAHKVSIELGEFVSLDFGGTTHLIPLHKLGTTDFHSVRYARKGCRIRITYSSPLVADPLVNSTVPDILKAELVSTTPEVYDLTVRTYFPDKIKTRIGEDGTVIQSKKIQ